MENEKKRVFVLIVAYNARGRAESASWNRIADECIEPLTAMVELKLPKRTPGGSH
jgi:hypothetical protein